MRLLVLAASALVLAGCAASGHPTASPSTLTRSAATAVFLDRARSTSSGLASLSDRRLEQLATASCDDLALGENAGDAGVSLQQSWDVGSLSDSQASDFVQAAVLYACPNLYNPGDYLHPGRFKIR